MIKFCLVLLYIYLFLKVSFEATLTSTPTTNRIKFDQVRLNDGGHYDGTTGEFTCPVSGIYFFSMLMASPLSAGPCKAQLKQNSDVLTESWLRENPVETHGTISGNRITRCGPGDAVFVEVTDCSDLTSIHPGLTKFSGVLLNID